MSQTDTDTAPAATATAPLSEEARSEPEAQAPGQSQPQAVSTVPDAGATSAADTERLADSSPPARQPASDAELLQLPALFSEQGSESRTRNIDLLRDVDLHVKIELGRSRMFVEDVLRLGQGSVVELDKLAGDPVDVLVNERLVARGEVLVLNDSFCVRINEILSSVEDMA